MLQKQCCVDPEGFFLWFDGFIPLSSLSVLCVGLPLVIPPNLTWLKAFICYAAM